MRKIIFGPPGTGKTTRLLNIVEQELRIGVPPDRIAYLAFTRKAAQEAVQRACTKFKLDKKDLPWFRTIHSFVFKSMNYSQDEIMKPKHYAELSDIIKVPLVSVTSADEVGVSIHNNEHLHIYDLSRARGTTLKQEYKRYGQVDGGFEKTNYITKSLIKYKNTMHVRDYTDLLEDYCNQGAVPNLEVVIVDEAQDMSYLQWQVVDKIMKHAARVYLAGDDDQAIFDWAGADPNRLINAKDWEKEVLQQSYRIPKTSHDIADRLITRIKHRQPKSWRPRDYKGFSRSYAYRLSSDSFNKGQWMILARTNYLLDQIEHDLKQYGHYYSRGNQPSISNKLSNAVSSWNKLRRKQEISIDDVKSIYYYMTVGQGVKRGFKGMNFQTVPGQTFSYRELRENYGLLITNNVPWQSALDKVPSSRSIYLQSIMLRNKKELSQEPRIKLSTIHGAKGGEADHVMLLTDLSRKADDSFLRNRDSERRVFYVGATRAKKSLHIIRSNSSREFTEIFQ
jgi:DNA helicase-2/ATP-dependent DNA helicase PcrA